MHFDHGKRVAPTIGAKRGTQTIGFLGISNTAGCQSQECLGCRGAIGNIFKIRLAFVAEAAWPGFPGSKS